MIRDVKTKEEFTTIDYYCGRDDLVSTVINALKLDEGAFVVNERTFPTLVTTTNLIELVQEHRENEGLQYLKDVATHTLYKAMAKNKDVLEVEEEHLADIKHCFLEDYMEDLARVLHLYQLLSNTQNAYTWLNDKDNYEIVILKN